MGAVVSFNFTTDVCVKHKNNILNHIWCFWMVWSFFNLTACTLHPELHRLCSAEISGDFLKNYRDCVIRANHDCDFVCEPHFLHFDPGSGLMFGAAYLEIWIDVFWDDEFGLWFVLTIDNVHLELSVILLEEVAKLDRVLYTLLKVLQKVTAKQKK